MSKGTLVALGAGVVALIGVGMYLRFRNRQPVNPTDSRAGGAVPLYVGGNLNPLNPSGPPLPAAGKIPTVFQQVGGAVQEGLSAVKAGQTAFEEGKKTWDSLKGYFG